MKHAQAKEEKVLQAQISKNIDKNVNEPDVLAQSLASKFGATYVKSDKE